MLQQYKLASILIVSLTFGLMSMLGCRQPYSPAAYRAQSLEQKYAIICHNNKQTLRVPAEEWKEHRLHGDYRGPCRTRKLAGKNRNEEVKNTTISYDNARPRAKESYERWAAKEAIKQAQIDSLKAAYEAVGVKN